MLLFNLKIAMRNLWRNKVFSVVNIFGLSLSMACCMSISLYLWNELRVDTFHTNYSNIYRLTEKQEQAGKLYNVAVTPGPLAPVLQKDFPEVINTVRLGYWSGMLKNGDHTFEQKNIQLTDNSIFSVFNFPLLKGNAATALQSPDEIVITENLAEKYFGKDWQSNPLVIGQIFHLGNDADFKLVGVAKNVPANSSIQFDVLLPMSWLFKTDPWSDKWNSNNYHTYIQLKDGTDAVSFEKKVKTILHKYNADTKDILLLQPLKKQYLFSEFDFKTDWGKRSNIKYIKIFSGVALLLLIIACINFINLSTARSLKRSMEVGVRKVNGATQKQLVFQFLVESLLISFVAGILSIIIIRAAQPLLESLTGSSFNTSLSQSMLLPFFFLAVFIIGCLAGAYPAFVLSSFKPARVFKSTGATGSGKRFRQGLIVGQFTISVTLISCTFFMYRQLHYMQHIDLGFKKDKLISVRLGGQLAEKSGAFKHDLENIAGIAATAPATMLMVGVENSSYIEWDGMQEKDKFLITQANIDPGFIPALGMQLVSGNNFSRQLTNDTANYIINEEAAARLGNTAENVIGRKVKFWGAKGTIIGVVKNFNFKPLRTGIEPFLFRYQPQDRYFNLFVKITPVTPKQVIEQIEKVYKKYERDVPFEFTVISDVLDRSYSEDRRMANIILLFSNLTIFIGCLGLFGLTVFAAEQRIKEIGIRKVLGAGIFSISALLSKDLLKLVVLAIITAVPVAWYCTSKWLDNYAYRIEIDWWVFVLTGLLVIVIALLTVIFHAIKAAVANPVNSLRSE